MQSEKCKNKKSLTREGIIKAVKAAGKRCGGALSRDDFLRETGLSEYHIRKFFAGRWLELLKVAGVKCHPFYHPRLSDEEILEDYHRIVRQLRRIPTWDEIRKWTRYSQSAYEKHFGTIDGILREFLKYLNEKDVDRDLALLVRGRLVQAGVRREGGRARRGRGEEYGEVLNCCGLRYAPTNERGVIYLFGVLGKDLGFLVEKIGSGYPDCEAKRRVWGDSGERRWRSVRIEFEYKSSNFLKHEHNPDSCDIIVCWENDWAGCPVDVIELRRVVGKEK
jgi:hypothetical protein